MIYAAEVLARHTPSKLLEKLLDSALCSVKMDLCTVDETRHISEADGFEGSNRNRSVGLS